MAAYIPTSDINLLDAWNLIDSTSFLDAENTTEQTGAGGASSQSFTPGAITVWGFAFKFVSVANSAATFTASIQQGGSNVSGTSVTISGTSIPTDGGWVVLKFSSPVTLLAATAYTIRFSSSVASAFTVFRNPTIGNLSRALITTTTAVPTTNDQLIIAGYYTGTSDAGSDVTVTLNQTGTAVQFGTTALTQSISVSRRGILQLANSASQSYVMKHRGICQVRGGTLRLGTSGSRLDSTSSFVWTADSVATADSGWHFHSGTVDIYGANNRAAWTNLTADSTSGTPKQLTVASTTGFVAGDTVYVTTTNGTTRTQSDVTTVSSIDSSTTLTVASMAFSRTGTTDGTNGDRRARVVNLSRNILLQGNSVSLGGYIDITNSCAVNFSYAAFWYLGSTASTTGKRGIDLRSSSASAVFVMAYCSVYVTGTTNGINLNFSATVAPTTPFSITYSTFIKSGNTSINLSSTAVSVPISITYCLVAEAVANPGIVCNSTIHTVQYCEIIGTLTSANVAGIHLQFDNTNTIATGVVSDNYIAFNGTGIITVMNQSSRAYICNNNTFVENAGSVVYLSFGSFYQHKERQVFSGWTAYGGSSGTYPVVATGSGLYDFIGCTFNKGATGTWTRLVDLTSGAPPLMSLRFINCTVSNVSFVNWVDLGVHPVNGSLKFVNCTGIGSSPMPSADYSFMGEDYVISSQKHNGTNDSHMAAIRNGIVQTDATIVDTGRTRSSRLTPNSASVKCGSAMVWRVRVTGGTTITPQVRWRKSVVGDGAAYNGNQPRLIIKRNDAVGVSSDTVLATGTNAANGAWENQSGTSVTFTDEGEVCLYVDCDGTTGWINIDSISVGSESNDMTYWNDGMPVQYLSGGGSSASARNNPFLCQAVG